MNLLPGHTDKEIREIVRLADRKRWLGTVIGFVLAFGGVGWALNEQSETQSRSNARDVKSCEVQARGLKSTKYLRGALHDLDVLLTPKDKKGKAAVKAAPANVKKPYRSLKHNLDKYVQIQSKQPKSRKC